MAGFNLLKALQTSPSLRACGVGGHWNDKLWAEASLPFTNDPRHSLRSLQFTFES